VCLGATDPEAAVGMAREVFARAERVLGPNHPTTLDAGNSVGSLLFEAGRFAAATAVLRVVIDRCEQTLGKDHPQTLERLGNLAAALVRLEQYPAAEVVIRRGLAGGRQGVQTLVDRNTLGVVLYKQAKFAEARQVFAALDSDAVRELPAGHWLLGQFRKCHGDCLGAAGDHAAAVRELTAGLELLARHFPADHIRVRRAREALLAAYDATGQLDAAADLRARMAGAGSR
jgi:hypothetical protein